MPNAIRLLSFLLYLLYLGLNLSSFTTGDGIFVYSGFRGTEFTVDGKAQVLLPEGLLQLSNGTEAEAHAFYPTPLRFRKSPYAAVQSFSVSFIFGIIPDPGYTDYSPHGITFFVGPNKNFSSAYSDQYLGLFNSTNNGNSSNHVFAVELDTNMNSEFRDINDNHVGINLNSLISTTSSSAGHYDDRSGYFQNLKLISGEAMRVWIEYNEEALQINVTLAPFNMAKPVRPLISATYNLSAVLTEPSYVGFSSTTGQLRSTHYILGWSFGMNRTAPALDITRLPRLPHIVREASQKMVLAVILPITVATFLIAIFLIVLLLVRRRRKYAEVQEDWEVEFGPHRFSLKDLFRATEGFNNRHLLGRGGFGRVYKGVLPKSKLEIAVKRVSHESQQGIKEFIAEVVSIGRLRHRNIVQLLGYCRRKTELLLVYDFMPNGSLDKYLYGSGEQPILDWILRFRIIKGVASGLLYLHREWEQVVIHRDVKASNVLLDEEMNGRLGDFGLARLYDHGTDMQTTHLAGTIGYLAPELVRTGKASPFTDVFAFGIFVLEVTCGRKPIDHKMHNNQLMLVDWVLDLWHEGSITDAMDSKLQNDYDADEACLVLKLEFLPTDMVQSERINPHVPYYQSLASNGTMSGLSGGR
ncbi:L-type lectin-domain containing receptor kinase IV.1 isoform X1 [Brachypodium distachyon]|uniref:L-type lectin-domain containing receptor kinase IV.1 isoform X1 n=1 Tax=Brachypodium distachyon TaxID=15368 RepID=UPI000D0CB196|nr:L-type lectin-domain containing receptor kinase IV.1 isoform X1 [Brachypodium distachyon]|eukprot:XP_024312603.1 L-type lectin-domain containing receptor kinase IV.1 isoform X1 [Brachypodium distachyon]